MTSRKTGKLSDPFYTFVSGSAGTGKSHLIKAIYQAAVKTLRSEADTPDDIVCLLTAPSGPATYNIHGQTLHSAFSFPQCLSEQSNISQARLSSLRVKYTNLFILIIDEISMVGTDFLHLLNKRLIEIKGTINSLFEGVSVLAFGDLYQLPPVDGAAIFKLLVNSMWFLYGSLWDNFTGVQLTQIMRQKNDRSFAELPVRLCTKSHTSEDRETLSRRIISTSDTTYPSEALHVFATNKLVNDHNAKKRNSLTTHVYIVRAEDTCKELQIRQVIIAIRKDP